MDSLVSLEYGSISEVQMIIANNMKTLRLSKKLTRETLGKRSGVPAVSIKKFERMGEISLKSLLKIAQALAVLSQFAEVVSTADAVVTAEDLKARQKRKKLPMRGSK